MINFYFSRVCWTVKEQEVGGERKRGKMMVLDMSVKNGVDGLCVISLVFAVS